MKKLILLNGLKECGKSTASKHLHTLFEMKDRQCKERLHELTMMIFNVPEETYWHLYNTRELKDTPSDHYIIERDAYNDLMIYLNDLGTDTVTWEPKMAISPRNAMIYVSEFLIKPTLGKDYFGRYRVLSMEENEVALEDSAGFIEELYPAIDILGQENIILIRILGRGHNDGGDSRKLIPDGIIDNTINIMNDNTVTEAEFLQTVTDTVSQFIGNRPQNDKMLA